MDCSIKVRLEPLTETLLEWARELHNDPEVLSMLGDPHVVSTEEQVVWFEKLKQSKSSQRVVALVNGMPVGLIRLDQIDYNNLSVCVGLDIHKNFRGQKYAKPIYKMVLDDWFFNKEFNRAWLMVGEYNRRAFKLYEELGFIYEGTQRKALLKDGLFFDYHMMSVLKEEWNKNE